MHTCDRRAAVPALSGVALVLAIAALPAIAVAPQAEAAAFGALQHDGQAAGVCVEVSEKAAPVGEVVDSATGRAAVRGANDLSQIQMARIEADPAAWVDSCGAIFFVDAAHPKASDGPHSDERAVEGAAAAAAAVTANAPNDVFDLSSRPGANRTIYLDFTGHPTLTNSSWNQGFSLPSITAEPYSLHEPADTNFDTEERAEIYQAWRSVAEDYAPFDVNVTTREPAPEALGRSSTADPTYGTRVVITPHNELSAVCGCGGVAYLGTFDQPSADRYQPAWVFSDSSGYDGISIAQTISHEVGHNFGLTHDGNATRAYDYGAYGWAPIMGASYYKRISQWSRGEYPGANNGQDDTAIIASAAPLIADDHAATAAFATPLVDGATAAGLLTTSADVDAFTFTAVGDTHLSLAGPAGVSNTDLSLTILNASGHQIASANPTRPDASEETALHASWTAALPATPATYTALVDGVGFGNPSIAGGYSDYGSLGAYTLSLATDQPQAIPLVLTAVAPTLTAEAGTPISLATLATVSGGYAPYTWTATGMPGGMILDPDTGQVSGTITYPGLRTITLTVTDARRATTSLVVEITITSPPPALTATVYNGTVETTVGEPVDVTLLSVTGGEAPYAYTTTDALPAGLTLHPATGRLTGIPTTAGTSLVFVTATDQRGNALPAPFTVKVYTPLPPPPPTTPGGTASGAGDDTSTDGSVDEAAPKFRTGTVLPHARSGASYRTIIKFAGPAATAVRTGKLPKGVTSKRSGNRLVLKGKPKVVGTYRIKVALNLHGASVKRTFRLTVRR